MHSSLLGTDPSLISVTDLPFVKKYGKKDEFRHSFWEVKPSGIYPQDCSTGRQYAQDAIYYIRATGTTALLGWIVFDMPKGNDVTGIEVGFLSAISERL